jgi:hypothetical protein
VSNRTTLSVSAAHIATVRGALKANGVMRYGQYERSNTYPALAALDALAARIAELETALRKIADNVGYGDYVACACITEPEKGHVTCTCAPQFRRIARAALADAKETEA